MSIGFRYRANNYARLITKYFCIHIKIDMEAPEFKDFAKTMVDFIAEYLENIRER